MDNEYQNFRNFLGFLMYFKVSKIILYIMYASTAVLVHFICALYSFSLKYKPVQFDYDFHFEYNVDPIDKLKFKTN